MPSTSGTSTARTRTTTRLLAVPLRRLALALLALLTAVAAVAPASAQPRQHRWGTEENAFRVRLGQFEPEGDSGYWDENFAAFDGSIDGFEDLSFGADFVLSLGRKSAIMFSGDIYEGEEAQAYLDFVDGFGSPIVHTTRLRIASATAAYVFSFTDRQASVRPYVGAGGGVYDWELEESGDFIDFGVEPLEIFTDSFVSGNTTLGWFWLAGLEVPIGPQWSIFAEGRWQRVDDDLEDDFADLNEREIDLSGRHIYGGFAWTF